MEEAGPVPHNNTMETLGLEEFALLLGASVDEIPEECRRLIRELNFRYEVLELGKRDKVLLKVLKTLESDLPISGKARLGRWGEGWSENLGSFVASGYDTAELIPRYYRRGKTVMRLFGQYVLPEDPSFELNVLAVLTAWLGKTFLRDVGHVYEFGCGPAHNLVALAKLFPEKHFHGLDWTVASQDIVKKVAESQGINIDGRHFDMFSPDESYRIKAVSAVMTMGALEQLGQQFEQFLQYLLKQPLRLCIHVEPIYEVCDQSNLLDFLAAKYMKQRGYLQGYLTRLKELEKLGRLKILRVKKTIGSLYYDGWTIIVWKPC